MYIKYCSGCGSNQEYKSKGNYNRAVRNNTLCKKCSNKVVPDSVRNKISEKLKGKPKSKEHVDKMRKSLIKLWSDKSDSELQNWKSTVSKTTKDRWSDNDYKERVSNSIKANWDSMSDEERTVRYIKQQSGGAGVCKYIEVGGYTVYGQTEYRFISKLINDNAELPKKQKRNGISTPYGMTFIDFEYDSHYVEVKSKYTYDIFINQKDTDNSQYNKQMWVNFNIKPVKVYVEMSKNIFKEHIEWN